MPTRSTTRSGPATTPRWTPSPRLKPNRRTEIKPDAAPGPAPPARIVAELVRCGLVEAAAACDGAVTLHDHSQSNHVFIVSVADRARLVVKQQGPDPGAASFLETEAAAYRWLAAADLADLAPGVAAFPDRGAGRSWLVLEALADARPLGTTLPEQEDDLQTVLEALAAMLARLHRRSEADLPARAGLHAEKPWVLELAFGTRPDFAAGNPAASAALADAEGDREIMSIICSAVAGWRPAAAIHGDVKWDNVLIQRDRRSIRLWLIDWELAAWGDPLWDLAAVIEGLLTIAVFTSGAPDLEGTSGAVRAAIAAYGLSTSAVGRLTLFVAARLVQVTVQLAGMMPAEDSAAVRGTLLELAKWLAADSGAWIAAVPAGAER